MRVVGISGSLRPGSHNTELLRAAAEALPPGAQLVVFDRLAELPHYEPELDAAGPPEAAESLREALRSADALLIATPEYNGSLPGALKNAIDWGSRPRGDAALAGLPTAVIGASTGLFGAVWAQADARRVLGIAGADVLDRELPVGQADEALRDGGLPGPVAEELRSIVGELAGRARSRQPVPVP